MNMRPGGPDTEECIEADGYRCTRITFIKSSIANGRVPAHTPVPEYIRLIAAGRFDDAYMVNWQSNVFPGILGRTCDRPCEPACRRGRVEDGENRTGDAKPEPVAICRLKRVAADHKDDIRGLPAQAPAAERQARRARRRWPGVADRRA